MEVRGNYMKVKIDYEAMTSQSLRELVAEIEAYLDKRYRNAGKECQCQCKVCQKN